MAALPAPATLPAWRKPALSVLWAAAGLGAALALPTAASDVARELFRLAAHPVSLLEIAAAIAALGAISWAGAAYVLAAGLTPDPSHRAARGAAEWNGRPEAAVFAAGDAASRDGHSSLNTTSTVAVVLLAFGLALPVHQRIMDGAVEYPRRIGGDDLHVEHVALLVDLDEHVDLALVDAGAARLAREGRLLDLGAGNALPDRRLRPPRAPAAPPPPAAARSRAAPSAPSIVVAEITGAVCDVVATGMSGGGT